jgi:hypothetical protein
LEASAQRVGLFNAHAQLGLFLEQLEDLLSCGDDVPHGTYP